MLVKKVKDGRMNRKLSKSISILLEVKASLVEPCINVLPEPQLPLLVPQF